ncbi:uncharacterized protein Dvir_GJ15995 [Drosophila virilis]|uniref:Uncharacterized protein n=1 Tax=Drosophila virilis TaxID=7244 RepID=B4MAX0_DROVI|nr:uncharacterized protein Dvir_GJ15995 [Drosophila virilis]
MNVNIIIMRRNITKTIAANSNNNSSNNSNRKRKHNRYRNRNRASNSVTHCNCKNNINRFAESANRTVNKKKILLATVVCVPTAWVNDINLTPPKQSKLSLTLTWTLPLPLQFLAALVQLLLVTTNHKSELHHMLCDLTIQRHTVAITYDLSLSETPTKKGAPRIPQKPIKGFKLCMNSKRRTISHRTSSNRHRKLQPFRYT